MRRKYIATAHEDLQFGSFLVIGQTSSHEAGPIKDALPLDPAARTPYRVPDLTEARRASSLISRRFYAPSYLTSPRLTFFAVALMFHGLT